MGNNLYGEDASITFCGAFGALIEDISSCTRQPYQPDDEYQVPSCSSIVAIPRAWQFGSGITIAKTADLLCLSAA
jgi:hypothetical protein